MAHGHPNPPVHPNFPAFPPPRISSQSGQGARCITGCGAGIRHLPLTLFLTALIWWGMRCGSQIPPLVIPPPPPGPAATCRGPPGPVPGTGRFGQVLGLCPPHPIRMERRGGRHTDTPRAMHLNAAPNHPSQTPPHSPQGLAAPCRAPRGVQGPLKPTGTPFPRDVPPLLAAPKPPGRDGAGTPDPQSLTCQLGAFPSPVHGSSSAGAPRSPPEPPGPVAACSQLPGARPLAAGK